MEEAFATQIPFQGSEDSLYVIVSSLDLDRLPAALPTSGRTPDPEGENITHIFFPVRWIPFKSQRQLDGSTHPDYDAVHKANEREVARLCRRDTRRKMPRGKRQVRVLGHERFAPFGRVEDCKFASTATMVERC